MKLVEEKSGCVQYFRKKLEEHLHVFYHTILDKFEPLQQVLLHLHEPHQGLLRHAFQLHSSRHIENSVMPALKRTRLTASAWRKANWCINCVLMRVMERRERDNS